MSPSPSRCSSPLASSLASRFASVAASAGAPVVASLVPALLGCCLIVFGCLGAFSTEALAQNPVPFVNQPLVPDAAAPGGPDFTLTVNGTGFVSGAVVDWNGSPLATQFVSRSQLTATVPAADIATASTASVTVVNPVRGGVVSNVAFFAVTSPGSSVAFVPFSPAPAGSDPSSIAVGDFNGDGKLDLAVANWDDNTVSILLGDGTGNFTLASSPATGPRPISVAVGDFNGDGKLDLAVANWSGNTVSILLGDGTGHFTLISSPATGYTPSSVAVGDFNGDGKLDLAVANLSDSTVSILLGDGTGNFTLASSPATGSTPSSVAVGDFNGDGKLDLAVANQNVSTVSILLGDGTGNFTLASSPDTGFGSAWLAVGDFNGDGKLDLAVFSRELYGRVSILLGDGAGNFVLDSSPSTGSPAVSLALGDFNGDGRLDLALLSCATIPSCTSAGTLSVLLGDGTGNFTLASATATDLCPTAVALGDFNGDGRLDVAVANCLSATVSILLQVGLSPTSLSFGAQLVFTSSAPQTVTLTNPGNSSLITSIVSSGDFAQTNTCGSAIAAGASCTISVTFTPTAEGVRGGAITIAHNATGSQQIVNLSGIGLVSGLDVTLSTTSLLFPDQQLQSTSAPQSVTVTNFGSSLLDLTSIVASGDFAQTNTCGTSLAGGASCIISVTFAPTSPGLRLGTITITDNAPNSPQIVNLRGLCATEEPPVPFVNQPLVPDATSPGGSEFTLTVKGTGFVSGAVVDWNGSPLATQFVGGSQLTATVPAADIAEAGTASVTVVNPSLSGGMSNSVFFTTTANAGNSLTFTLASSVATGKSPISVAAADFNGDGKLDLAVLNSGDDTVSILLGDGTGHFTLASSLPTGLLPISVLVGDFNGDGRPDLAILNQCSVSEVCSVPGGVSILLGDGTGGFTQASFVAVANLVPTSMALADFNGDGNLDVAVIIEEGAANDELQILLGDGAGNLTAISPTVLSCCNWPNSLTAGDFNSDGHLDVAVTNPVTSTVSILLGDGTGSFREASSISSSALSWPVAVEAGDFTGDGWLDLAVANGGSSASSIFLGDGTGNFTLGSSPAIGFGQGPLALADFNGDGKLDMAIGTSNGTSNGTVSILTGDGTGKFTLAASPATGETPVSIAVGDFNGDGRLDLAVANEGDDTVSILLQVQSEVTLSPSGLSFGEQNVSTTSGPQTVTLTNTGSDSLDITSIAVTGDFAQTNTCASLIVPGASCTISVTFTPVAEGARTGTITVTDDAPGSPQTISLTGTGVTGSANAASALSATNISFGNQDVGSAGVPHMLTLTNAGGGSLTIGSIAAGGDFAETNGCPKSIAAGASCIIGVTFTPTAPGTRTGTITITDNAPGSPQVVTLTGTGIGPAVSFSASSMSVGGEIVGTTSGARTVTLTNSGNATLTITGMTIAPSSFTETSTCKSTLAAAASCTITVTFTPATSGAISGVLSITDIAPGSPQEVTLSGTGQDFDIGPYNLSQTIPRGTSAPYDLKVTPIGGFNQTVSLACSGEPAQATCSVSPASVTLNGFNYSAVELKITTQGASSVPPMKNRPPYSPGLRLPGALLAALLAALLVALLGMGLLLIARRRKASAPARLRLAAALGALLLLTIAWIACGGGPAFVYTPPSGGTPSGNYVITVTATSGHLSHAVTVKLTVE